MKKNDAILEKISDERSLLQKLSVWRFHNKKIIFTNGCFDILHKGHAWLLNTASGLEDNAILIVGLNSDASVKKLKGDGRPINNVNDRAFLLASLYAVDAIIIFEEDTPDLLIKMIKPDVLVKGGDYNADEIVGADTMKLNGGKVVIIPYLENYSTSKTINQLADQ